MSQVLDNLVVNALDVSPSGSSVVLETEAVDGWVEIHVVDQGPGMTEEERVRAFDRFWRGGQGQGRFGGSGLGLAIARKLVRADGGDVELRDAPGGGLDAVIRLRRADRTAP